MAVGDYISEIQTSDRNTHPIGSSFWVSSETWNGKTNTEVENEIKTKFINLTEITWSSLKSLVDAGTLVPGQYYRITDYTCTTTTAGTKSAGHVFDIIVRADSVNKLNEEAHAIQHTGDSYFVNNNLSAWKIWYCLDNDTNRFTWADNTNGKGVIYRMIDEFNNDIPYDFKNIQFYRGWDSSKSLWSIIFPYSTRVPCYTFSSSGSASTTEFTDSSLISSNNVYSNVIKKYINSKKQTLNNICFFGLDCYYNTFEDSCYNNTFGDYCNVNTFKSFCYGNTFTRGFQLNIVGSYNRDNTFGSSCFRNIFGNSCGDNTFGDNFRNNILGNYCSFNIFGEYCYCNTFGNNCMYIKFKSDGSSSSIYSYYRHNHFGDGCQYILFKGAENSSSDAQVQNYNFAQGLQGTSNAYLTVDGVRNRSYETKVAKNSAGELKIYCEADLVQ